MLLLITLSDTREFESGACKIAATGSIADREHPNARRLTINTSSIAHDVAGLVASLAKPMRACLGEKLPQKCLPSAIVLKKEKDGRQEEFDNEVKVYGMYCKTSREWSSRSILTWRSVMGCGVSCYLTLGAWNCVTQMTRVKRPSPLSRKCYVKRSTPSTKRGA